MLDQFGIEVDTLDAVVGRRRRNSRLGRRLGQAQAARIGGRIDAERLGQRLRGRWQAVWRVDLEQLAQQRGSGAAVFLRPVQPAGGLAVNLDLARQFGAQRLASLVLAPLARRQSQAGGEVAFLRFRAAGQLAQRAIAARAPSGRPGACEQGQGGGDRVMARLYSKLILL